VNVHLLHLGTCRFALSYEYLPISFLITIQLLMFYLNQVGHIKEDAGAQQGVLQKDQIFSESVDIKGPDLLDKS
jgi:hypothetical protein